MRVKDLPERPPYKQYLFCGACQAEYSATKGDYFLAGPDHVLRCCGEPLALVNERTTRKVVGV